MFITDTFGKRLQHQGPLSSFIENLGDYLNVTPAVMQAHYNRASKYDENIETQNILIREMVESVEGEIEKDRLDEEDNITVNSKLQELVQSYSESRTLRPIRTFVDDLEWLKFKLEWEEKNPTLKEDFTSKRRYSKKLTKKIEESEEELDIDEEELDIDEDEFEFENESGDEYHSDSSYERDREHSRQLNLYHKMRSELHPIKIIPDDEEKPKRRSRRLRKACEGSDEEKIILSSCTVEEEKDWEVEKIIGRQFNFETERLEYLVQWRGYDATWEPLINLGNCLELVNQYEVEERKTELKEKWRKWKDN